MIDYSKYIIFYTLPDGMGLGLAELRNGFSVTWWDTEAEMPLSTIMLFDSAENAHKYIDAEIERAYPRVSEILAKQSRGEASQEENRELNLTYLRLMRLGSYQLA